MHCTRKISEDLIYLGGSDRRLALFENMFPISRGVSYNSYLLLDEKTVLFDTVDGSVGTQFLENLTFALGGRNLDYMVIHHMEPDHCVLMMQVLREHPETKLVCSAKALAMVKQFFCTDATDIEERTLIAAEGDKLSTGNHMLCFIMAPMVHWPEVMVTYDEYSRTLFSADAFGTFGALSGNIFDDEIELDSIWINDARRYYTNIVGKYGAQVQALLKKAALLDIACICPLHGPVLRSGIELMVEKYQKWSTYEPEDRSVLLIYASMYGSTENAANVLATCLAEKGIKNIAMYDVSKTDTSELIGECFRHSHFVFASPTYNGALHPKMENLLADMQALNIQNRTVSVIENGSWAPVAAKQMKDKFEAMKNMKILENQITVKSALAENQMQDLQALAEIIASDILNKV